MSDQYIEKLFLYFVAVSLVAHLVIFAFILFYPGARKQPVGQQTYTVDLEDLPELKTTPPKLEKKAKRHSVARNRVYKEVAPKGETHAEKNAEVPRTVPRKTPQVPVQMQQKTPNQIAQPKAIDTTRPASRGGELLRQHKRDLPELAKLYPSVNGLADLEQSYRKKYGPEVEEGETKFLNTDDILFGSFLRRFETAVYGVWRYPADAARLGIQGMTPVKITFNRKGEIENVQLLESSGSKILDKEVFRTLGAIGPIGSLPKGYPKDKFHLIAFFEYGIISGASKGSLH